jgi:UDP-N-acetylglucosamine--N-acetylmuramyl-(pentapeptide) pyrophosphoryl-undecaprenol N-acetylglucosamine transferase
MFHPAGDSMSEKGARIIIAGGGTGGHLFPGVAIAEEFLKRDKKTEFLFVSAGSGLEKNILHGLGFSLHAIRIEGFKGRSPMKAAGALMKLPGSIWESYRTIRDYHPQIVIGLGSYASGPVVLAACLMGIKTAIAEQNALPGITNRILGRFADRVFLTYGETRKWFPIKKTIVSGNPVRAAFLAGAIAGPKNPGKFTILVFGGSQGARSINRMFLEALPSLKVEERGIRIIHQTGNDDLQYVSEAYRSYGLDVEVHAFIREMAGVYGEADLVICRAGATSIAEITVMGKAAILIPFPFAVDDHQRKNAEALVKAGAAVMIEERGYDGRKLTEIIEQLYSHRDRLREMEDKSASLGNAGAAAVIVDACLSMIADKRTLFRASMSLSL